MFRRISRSLTDDFRSTKKQFDLFFCFWDFQYVEFKHTKKCCLYDVLLYVLYLLYFQIHYVSHAKLFNELFWVDR